MLIENGFVANVEQWLKDDDDDDYEVYLHGSISNVASRHTPKK